MRPVACTAEPRHPYSGAREPALGVALIDEASDPLAASSKELSAMPRVEPGKIENAVSKIGCETRVWRSLPLPER